METLTDKRVIARKEHKCDFCNNIIKIGEEYRHSTHTFDGEIYNWHSCDRCKEYVSECFSINYNRCSDDDGLTEEMFMEFMNDYHNDVYREWKGVKYK